MTDKCRISEKQKYWEEFESNRHNFLKMLMGDFKNNLRIPKKFVTNFKENLIGTIHFRGPSGFMWTVEAVRMNELVVLQNGWGTFVKDHSLGEVDMHVFRYIGHSTFNVLIFDSSGCEREGSYFVQEHTSACSNDACVLEQEDEEDSEEIIEWENFHMQKKNTNGRGRLISKAVDTNNHRQSKATGKKKARVGRSAVEREVLIVESEGDSMSSMEASEEQDSSKKKRQEVEKIHMKKKQIKKGTGRSSHQSKATKRKKPRVGKSAIEREVLCDESDGESVSSTLKLALRHSTKRPSFTVVMKASHVCRSFVVRIPKKWVKSHSVGDVRNAILKVSTGKKVWDVGNKTNNGGKPFTREWAKFVLDNNLEAHDVCVFELSDQGKAQANGAIMIFNVFIYRVLENIVPLRKVSVTGSHRGK